MILLVDSMFSWISVEAFAHLIWSLLKLCLLLLPYSIIYLNLEHHASCLQEYMYWRNTGSLWVCTQSSGVSHTLGMYYSETWVKGMQKKNLFIYLWLCGIKALKNLD